MRCGKKAFTNRGVFVTGLSAETGLNAPPDLAFLRFARIHLEYVPGRIAGSDRCLVVRLRIMVDMGYLVVPFYKYHIERNDDVFHPVMLYLITVMDKEHTVPGRQIRSVHKPAALLGRRDGRFGLEAAQFPATGIDERDVDFPDVRR